MKRSGHKKRAVFERYNIDDERDVIEAMSRLDTYTRERADQEKAAEEKAMAGNLAHIPAQAQPGELDISPVSYWCEWWDLNPHGC
jgi:hypothetical protein